MAQKRMFDKRITDSDKFTDLPNSSKALYFMAGMSADDRGFFQPRRLQKMNGFTDDDFKVLIAKRYFIPFESGVMVITDWNKNNYLDKNRITETEYIKELNLLKLINERYELSNVKQMFNQNSIEENSIEENSIVYDDEDIYTYYQNNIGSLTPRQYEIISNYQNEFNDEIIKEAINRASDNNGKTFKYVEGILKSWKQKGYTKLGEIQNEVKTKKEKDVPVWIDKKIDSEEIDPIELEKLEKEMSIFE